MVKQHSSFFSKTSIRNTIRSCYVINPLPRYQPPKADTTKPAIVKALVYAAERNNPARHEAWYTTPRINQKTGLRRPFCKRMNEHRARAINALMVGLADRLNILSGKVEASVEQLSNWCGLSTGTETKKSISRASRALATLEELGAIACERTWDETSHSYISKIIWVTELFFVLIGYELGKYRAAQYQQLAWKNKKLHDAGKASITLSHARRLAKEKHIKRSFEYRTQKIVFKQQLRHAKKLMQMEHQQARQEILNSLIKQYSQDQLEAMGHQGLRRQVDKRYYALRKLASAAAPPTIR